MMMAFHLFTQSNKYFFEQQLYVRLWGHNSPDVMKLIIHWGRQTSNQDITFVLRVIKRETQGPLESQKANLTES